MAAIARARVSLRVLGDGLEPEEVSALLGAEPSRSHHKGDPVPAHRGSGVERTGAWILDSALPEKAEIEEHLEALLARVTHDPDEWLNLTERFSATVLVSAFLDRYNEGFELSPRLSQALAERGLVIAFDIYSGDPEA